MFSTRQLARRSVIGGAFVFSLAAIPLSAKVIPASATPSAPTTSSSAPASASDCVTPATLESNAAIRPDGTHQSAVAGDGLGRIYTYDLHGSKITESIPPPSWNPLTASPAEIIRYGLPPRPTDVPQLQAWQNRVSRLKLNRQPTGMCETAKRNSVVHVAYSGNWAGGMSINNSATLSTFTSSEGEWYQTAFDAVCSGASAYSTWSGLGGWNSGKLIQSGTDVSGSLNGIYPFWEALSPSHPNPEVAFTSGGSIHGGDDVDSYTYFDTSYGFAYMSVSDYTTGGFWSAGFYSYQGASAWTYYDGTTVDYITEAPFGGSAPGGLYFLRKPHLGTTYYFRALPNGTDLKYVPSWQINEYYQHWMQVSNFDGIHAWSDYWQACY